MIVGVPKEIKTAEHRVALVPAGAESLIGGDGHTVLVEQGAGLGSGFTDDAYRAVGAEIAPSADAVWSRAELILKVKEPIEPEWARIRRGQVVFTYFHFAASEPLTTAIIKSGCIAIARMSGLNSFSLRVVPTNVPEVPRPAMKCVICPSVCSQSSRAVLS